MIEIIEIKDREKIVRLSRYVSTHPAEQMGEEARESHLELLRQVRIRYPRKIWFYEKFWNLDYALGGKLSGMRGEVYHRWIELFRE